MGIKFELLPDNIKRRIIADNPEAFAPLGGLSNPKPQSSVVAADAGKVRRQENRQSAMARRAGRGRVLVTITSYRRKLLDGDNLQGGAKQLRDEIARTLGLDDADPRLKFEYGQVQTTGKCGTTVKIEVMK